ncbi:MAG: hypothetical protein U1E54_01340 [Candidatus Levybacteria bacterium]|nr:hypothetical protein [Candidatus Levybacteria bacterium]
MNRYSGETIQKAHDLRALGKTYGEIRQSLKFPIPKSTLSEWCKNVKLPANYAKRIADLNLNNLNKGRLIAHEINKIKREEFFKEIKQKNLPISLSVKNLEAAKIALAMLCLGEARKYTPKGGTFSLGSSDPRIIVIFLELLKICFNFNLEKARCTVQCRADQNTDVLEKFWISVTDIPKRLFYHARIDPRTIGRPTKKKNYKGVLKIDYFDTKVHLELESLAQLIYNFLDKAKGPVA